MKSIIITGGGCEEAIDGVRSITNFSSGETSSTLATIFAEKGWNVTLLTGKRAITPPLTQKIDVIRFNGFDDLRGKLKQTLYIKKYDAVIHAAAVSDFSVSKVVVNGKEYNDGEANKISSKEELTVILKPNSKILPRIKIWGENLFVVGFKLTKNAAISDREKAVKKVFEEGYVDLVVSNDLSEIDQVNHLFSIFNKNGEIVITGKNKTAMGESLLKKIEEQREL